MEAEREKMRQGIRDKYKIHKKEEGAGAAMDFTEGRIGAPRKTPEVSFTFKFSVTWFVFYTRLWIEGDFPWVKSFQTGAARGRAFWNSLLHSSSDGI